jgi:hypothetical protein
MKNLEIFVGKISETNWWKRLMNSCKLGLVTTMSQLMIPNSNFDDSGSYKCEATSEYFENPVSATEGDFFFL